MQKDRVILDRYLSRSEESSDVNKVKRYLKMQSL